MLEPIPSATLRDSLASEVDLLRSGEEAAFWAYDNMATKNTLTSEDAQYVEARFRSRLAELGEGRAEEGPAVQPSPELQAGVSGVQGEEAPRSTPEDALPGPARSQMKEISAPEAAVQELPASDIAVQPAKTEFHKASAREVPFPNAEAQETAPARLPVVGKTIRLRDKGHRMFVATRPCLLCGRTPADPHHLRFAQPRALGRKVSDEFTVPMCRVHHDELHRHGDEETFWREYDIDPVPIALALWRRTWPESVCAPKGLSARFAVETKANPGDSGEIAPKDAALTTGAGMPSADNADREQADV